MYSIPLTVVFVSFNVCVAKVVCSMLNDCCLRLSNWFSYLDRKKNIQSETMQVGYCSSANESYNFVQN